MAKLQQLEQELLLEASRVNFVYASWCSNPLAGFPVSLVHGR